ncbi:MAG: hypothetical protein ACRDSL_15420 [Pseudonocardiaceae bacterium]
MSTRVEPTDVLDGQEGPHVVARQQRRIDRVDSPRKVVFVTHERSPLGVAGRTVAPHPVDR